MTEWGGEPWIGDEIYQSYRGMALEEVPDLSKFSLQFIGTNDRTDMVEDLRAMLKTHLSSLKISLH